MPESSIGNGKLPHPPLSPAIPASGESSLTPHAPGADLNLDGSRT